MKSKFRNAKARTIRRSIDEAAKIIAGGYETISRAFSHLPLRDENKYDEFLEVCKSCTPGGKCPECNCNYFVKLVMSDFKCGQERWSDG